MTISAATPAAEVRIDLPMVESLVRSQVPEAAQFVFGQRFEGRDAVVMRLGEDWAVRLPKRQLAADRQATEADWLPHVAGEWGFRAPIPVRVGRPTDAFPWRWSITPWVHGTPHSQTPLSALGAAQLGAALRQVHSPAPAQAPRHPKRSQTLLARASRVDDRLNTLFRRTDTGPWTLNTTAARSIYHRGALHARPAAAWAHLDLRADHIMTINGAFAGLIDWGDAAAGDPAADLGQALVVLPLDHWDALIQGYGGVDVPTFSRARAEAIDFATGLALSHDPADLVAGWHGLASLGVARRKS